MLTFRDMGNKHTFEASLTWEQKQVNSADSPKIYQKTHRISIDGKSPLPVSAAKSFKGDPTLHNPEDLLLSSLMSCHMMSYLYVCSQHHIEVISYSDTAKATLETYSDGSGKIIEVKLYPTIIIKNREQIDLALSLHEKANKLCFIANSCNFPVNHYPTWNIL